MKEDSAKPKNKSGSQVRTAFPAVCKWFEGETGKVNEAQSLDEISRRFHRFKASGTSPCDGCPLCQGHQ
jgi:hypothetical protein